MNITPSHRSSLRRERLTVATTVSAVMIIKGRLMMPGTPACPWRRAMTGMVPSSRLLWFTFEPMKLHTDISASFPSRITVI